MSEPGPARLTRRGLDAVACLRAGIEAVEPAALVRDFVARHPGLVGAARRVRLVAFGKAAPAMVHGALSAGTALKRLVVDAVAVVPHDLLGGVPAGVRPFAAGHPRPDAGSVRAGEAVRDLATAAGPDDLVVVLVSGGGSALLTLPPAGVPIDDVAAATDLLLRAGATIDELNCVRKHLDQLKGGRLARLARPARVLGLVLSDVVGDRLDVIASGPLSPDPTTCDNALAIVDRHALRGDLPASVLRHLEAADDETPKPDDLAFAGARVHVVGNNRLAADAVLAEAERRGYRSTLLGTEVTGEAREVGRRLAELARQATGPTAILAAGETTVTVTGSGKGGRSQEVALGAALALAGEPAADQSTIASLGTDGIDGPTGAAGAVADARTVARALAAGVDAAACLADNDAYRVFQALDDLVITGPTGTNVMDLMLALKG